MTIRIATLLRLSTKRQAIRQGKEDEPDIPAQRQAISDFLATKPDWVHVKEYQETGISAFKVSADDRDVLQDAMRDARAGQWKALVVFKADRLSRNSTEYPMVIAKLNKSGVEVWSVADAPGGKRLAVDNQMDKFLRFLEGWQAETESVNTQVRVATRMRQIAQEGRWCGSRVPFGYTLIAVKDQNGEPVFRGGKAIRTLAPHPEHAVVVREMFQRYIGGQGAGPIAIWLNRSGVPTYTGTTWSPQAVREMLRNPLYMGMIAYGRRSGLSKSPILVKGEHPALIASETYEQALALRSHRAALAPRQSVGTYALTGLLRCGNCDGAMGGITRRRVNAKGDPVERQGYRCTNGVIKGSCTTGEIRADRVEAAFLARLEELERPSGLRRLMELKLQEQQAGLVAAIEGRSRTEEQMACVKQALQRLDHAYLEAGLLSLDQYRDKRLMYMKRNHELEAALLQSLPSAPVIDLTALVARSGELRITWGFMAADERKVFVINLMQAHRLVVYAHADATVELRPRTDHAG